MEDDKFGWVLNIYLDSVKSERKNGCGEVVKTKKYADKFIVKFPKADAREWKNKKRILIIGDSVTQAHEVSTDYAYYDRLEELAGENYAVFAAGVGGYGNLQEYMLLEDVYNRINPQILIWQLCGNDIANNRYELDNASFFNNQHKRPYLNLETGEIEIKNPGFWLFDVSLFAKRLFSRILKLDFKYNMGILSFCNSLICLDSELHEKEYKNGFEVMDYLLKRIKNKYPRLIIAGFNTGPEAEQGFNKIFTSNGYNYLGIFYEHVDNIEGTNCKPLDFHWNILGNRIAGEHLYNLLKQTKLIN